MKEKKIVKTMGALALVFLVLVIASTQVKAPLGWWIWGIGFVLALGAQVVKLIFMRKVDKKERERFQELLRTFQNPKP